MIQQQAPAYVFDLRQLWSQQLVPAPLISAIELIAKAVFEVIVTPDVALQNVTEWCKKELCWKRTMEAQVQFDVTRKLRSLLIEKENDLELQRSSRKE